MKRSFLDIRERPIPGAFDLFAGLRGHGAACRSRGRPPTDPQSTEAGIGPVRAGERRRFVDEGGVVMRASYTVRFHDGAVIVEDRDQGRSVTNDAENVVAELRERGFDLAMPVIYRDTMGLWSGLAVSGGAFAGFDPLGKEERGDYDAARAVLRELVEEGAAWLSDARPENPADKGPFTEPLSDILDLDTWTETRGTATRQPDGSRRVEQEDGTALPCPRADDADHAEVRTLRTPGAGAAPGRGGVLRRPTMPTRHPTPRAAQARRLFVSVLHRICPTRRG